jgi:superfamily I DNA and RNA helicase
MGDSSTINIVRGTNDKPASTEALVDLFASTDGLDGLLMTGYPVIATAEGRLSIDAVYISPTRGIVVFDLVDGHDMGDYRTRQDDAATSLQARLLTHTGLVRRRVLQVPIATITFAPALPARALQDDDGYYVANAETLAATLDELSWSESTPDLFDRALSAIQSIASIRRSRTGRVIKDESSRGARLKQLEDSIATLDNLQNKAVVETVEGVQRIRGLAGSGKTIVLALKAAYLHAQHPDWTMAVTFNTRSLKGQFTRLINNFVLEQTGDEPNWNNVRIINAWGAAGGPTRTGIYYEFCTRFGAEYLDFNSAKAKFGRNEGFRGACELALQQVPEPAALYDVILVDEAQDFPPEFLRLCYKLLDEKKRLVYAYDELQSLSGSGLPPAEGIFGRNPDGTPLVRFDDSNSVLGARRDIILDKCYRNSRPVLVSAHALGFGTYRPAPKSNTTGLVQMFDQPSLWTDIGYSVKSGELVADHRVVLERTPETSPVFLEAHSPIEDLVSFHIFASQADQAIWVADQIEQNLANDELRHDDIVVINTDPLTTRTKLGPVRKALLDRNIMGHIAGVETSADVFFTPDHDSITCTGIFRAKGNEAGMIYIVNAEECQTERGNLAQVRNRLFTAITRSKAWVRVCGTGKEMTALIAEFEAVRAANFELRFKYPTDKELGQMQILHRDMTQADARNVKKRQASLVDLIEDLESGRLYTEDLDEDMVNRLRDILGG